ncbi:MAG: hypothetical protein AABY18_10035 [Candidatus Thermoplasmatota archaeon]
MRFHPDGLSLEESVQALGRRGFHASFQPQPEGLLLCTSCQAVRSAGEMQVLGRARIEDVSDPAESDESVVVGLRCPACRVLGTVVLSYGPRARRAELDVLEHLQRVPPAA